MNESYQLSRLAAQVGDQFLMMHHGFAQVTDGIEECLFAWNDKQATKFAISIDEPQREAFRPLMRQLTDVESCLRALTGLSGQVEVSLRQIQSMCQPCHDMGNDSMKNAEAAQYYSSEATSLAGYAQDGAADLELQLEVLGAPPI